MDKITVIIKDQEENESIVVAQLNDLEDQDIPFFKRVEHIEVEGNIIFPNIDLLFESDIDGKIYKLVAPVNGFVAQIFHNYMILKVLIIF